MLTCDCYSAEEGLVLGAEAWWWWWAVIGSDGIFHSRTQMFGHGYKHGVIG